MQKRFIQIKKILTSHHEMRRLFGKLKGNNTTTIIFVIIYILVFSSSILFLDQRKNDQEIQQVQIGLMSPSDAMFPKYRYIAEIAQKKINTHFNQSDFDLRLKIQVTNAASNQENALEITKKYHEEGVNLIVGYGWNSHLNSSLEYSMDNNMVLVSPASTSPLLTKSDNCFRLLPDDQREARAIASIITNYGIDTIVILQRNGSWGQNMAESFLCEYRANGGNVIDWITFTAENSMDIDKSLARASLMMLDAKKHRGSDKIGVLLIALEEASTVLLEAEKYSSLMNVTWFGTDATTLDQTILDNAGHLASRVGLLGPVNTHIYNEDYQEINELYSLEFEEPLDLTLANVYDACWLLALSVQEAESVSSVDVSRVFGDVAYNHYGITGPLNLNKEGDRSWIRYYIYGYYETDGNIVCLRAGCYIRLEKYGQQSTSIFHSPFDVLYDNFPYYIWEKSYDSK